MIRKAKLDDVEEIKLLLSHYAKKNLLIERSMLDLCAHIRDFFVFEKKGKIKGCCALHFCWKDMAEIRSLAVKKNAAGQGIGSALAEACLEEAKEFGMKKVFTLTLVPQFFEKLGFQTAKKEDLPHKIWHDCINCAKFPDKCDEIAMTKEL